MQLDRSNIHIGRSQSMTEVQWVVQDSRSQDRVRQKQRKYMYHIACLALRQQLDIPARSSVAPHMQFSSSKSLHPFIMVEYSALQAVTCRVADSRSIRRQSWYGGNSPARYQKAGFGPDLCYNCPSPDSGELFGRSSKTTPSPFMPLEPANRRSLRSLNQFSKCGKRDTLGRIRLAYCCIIQRGLSTLCILGSTKS